LPYPSSFQAFKRNERCFSLKISEFRPFLGQRIVFNSCYLSLIEDSTYVTSQGELRVQDAYALRCGSQVHGGTIDALLHVKEQVETEINSVTDNPLIFVDDNKVISGGNFHGQPLALAFDYLGIAISELANISERRIERLINPSLNNGLPAFLVINGGLNSGFMIVQYSAASLVSENKVLAHPSSVDSIPSSANQEDHVSMVQSGQGKLIRF
jgi:histidine ammonia-lyase